MREYACQRTNHDRCGIDHQRAVVACGVLDQIADGLAATATGHVLVRRRSDEPRLCQGLTRAAGRPVPAAAGTAGDQKVDRIYDLMAVRDRRSGDSCCQRCRNECATRDCPCLHFFLPKNFTDVIF